MKHLKDSAGSIASMISIGLLLVVVLASCQQTRETTTTTGEAEGTAQVAEAAPDTEGAYAEGEGTATAPDNTGINVRDRDDANPTAGDQPENEADRTMTQKVRQAVMADDSLSVTAKNIKIVTINGMVTLRGPVTTEAEKSSIQAKADQIAGAGKVDNQLEVTGR